MNIVTKAIEFATIAHEGQKRKYTEEPYINHPIAVMEMLRELNYHPQILAAAVLHDVVEDTRYTRLDIEMAFGIQVSRIVEGLTDVYTHDFFPNIRRKERKKLECYRLLKESGNVKSIKLADLIHNTQSILEHDKDFAKVYIEEKEELLFVLEGGDQRLMDMAVKSLHKAKKELGLK